jgi:hypothetical protein
MRLSICLTVAFCALPLLAGDAGVRAGERPHIEGVYFAQPPVLDGDLSDPCWQQAPRITDLKEIQTGGAPKGVHHLLAGL